MAPKKIEIKEKKTRRANTKLDLNVGAERAEKTACNGTCHCKSKHFVKLVAVIILTAIVVGGGVYIWQKGQANRMIKKIGESEKADLVRANDDLTKQLADLKTQLIKLKSDSSMSQKINLYYYNQAKDQETSPGAPACSADSVLTVIRELPKTDQPVDETIKMLLKGELTSEEQKAGFSTEFPHPGLKYLGSNLSNGTLTLSFDDPDNFTSGGSCRVKLLWASIEKTALQFPGVNKVEFSPNTLFQP